MLREMTTFSYSEERVDKAARQNIRTQSGNPEGTEEWICSPAATTPTK